MGVSLGNDDGIKVFLNGKQILANNANRASRRSGKAELKLAKGENHLLIKIVNNGGQGGMYFKLGGSSLPQEVLANLGQDVLTRSMAKLRDVQSVWPVAKLGSTRKSRPPRNRSTTTITASSP